MNTLNIPEPVSLKHDGELWISTGKNRFEKNWKNRKMLWSRLLQRLILPVRTPETQAEYVKMSKRDQDGIKDVGGFVGGVLKDGKRGNQSIESRSLITFDLDFAPEHFYEDQKLVGSFASACYSTHKHKPAAPRLRLIIPLTRPVSPDEYEAVARMLADEIGMDFFDASTFQPSRLMYWPSCSEDGEYFFDYQDLPFLDPDDVLSKYPDWRDVSQWPTSKQEAKARKALAKKQADPTKKPGVIGAFCRAYTVTAAIEAFLPDVYAPTGKKDRYTYTEGSTAGGLVIYGGDLFAYSNHGTDPAGGQLCNAFDLVRIHKFGGEDENVPGDTPNTSLPSYKAMLDFAGADRETQKIIDEERHEAAVTDFDFDDDAPEDAWKGKLQRKERSGKLIKNVINCELIFKYDPALQGLRRNLFSTFIEVDRQKPVPWKRQPGPWTDTDDAQLYSYIGREYTEFPRLYVNDQKLIAAGRKAYHPVKEYLNALPDWDGMPRVDTLLVDFLGAENSVYTREATAKTLTAAVRRIFEPGCKFDTMLVLSGDPGIGKSTLVAKLAGEWFSDSLTFNDMSDNRTGAEQIQGSWIIEIAELKGMKKTDIESVKAFLSRTEDRYRAAYAHNKELQKRQCVFFGTVNNLSGYLRDVTGNRRFWPIECTEGREHPATMASEYRDQVWAEIMFRYKDIGERDLTLSKEAEVMAERAQLGALESDDREGIVEEYLNRLLPYDWDFRDIDERRLFLGDSMAGNVQRETVTCIEVWAECFNRPINAMTRRDSYEISGMLKRLGWVNTGKRLIQRIYGRQRFYTRPEIDKNVN